MKCDVRNCRVQNARWRVMTDANAPYGERWRMIRLRGPGWYCKTHAGEKARELNFNEQGRGGSISLVDFTKALS